VTFVDAITAHVARDADNKPLNYHGQPGSRAQHAKSLEHYKGRIERLLLDYPRMGREGPEQWLSRVASGSPQGRDAAGRLAHVGRLGAILAKMDRDAAEEARRQEAASASRREAERDEQRRAAMPDVAELVQLKRTIDCAAEGERLLEQMFAAFTAHLSAQAARAKVNAIFDSARSARQTLRHDGEAVSTPLPKPPTIRDAPEGTVAFAAIIQQVIALRRH
jgi:hypothetical protein